LLPDDDKNRLRRNPVGNDLQDAGSRLLLEETRQLIFSENGVAKVAADIQFVGSISTESDTWLWAWANDSVDPQLSTSNGMVRDYGEEHGFNHLTIKKWHPMKLTVGR
jgi:hypothetical protein